MISPSADRLEFVDCLRGFALFGVFAANLLIFSGIVYLTDAQRAALFTSPLDAMAYSLERFFIENKFMGLFSFLFGISFWLFLSRAERRGAGGTGLFYRRIFWLFVIASLHGWVLWFWDILRFYALWAVLLPLFVRTPPKRLLAVALSCGVFIPAVIAGVRVWVPAPAQPSPDYDALALAAFSAGSFRDALIVNWNYDWFMTMSVGQIAYQVSVFGRLLLGLYVGRTFDFGNLEQHRPLLRRALFVGGVVGVIGSTVFAADLLRGPSSGPFLRFLRRLLTESGQLGLTLAYASALGLLFVKARWRPLILWFAPVGRMALTWFLFQTILGIWLFYGYAPGPGLMGQVPPSALAIIAVAGYAAQIGFARAWLSRFRFGPAEWLWRSLTYWERQPFKLSLPAPVRVQA
jgi:uncharacterized protein